MPRERTVVRHDEIKRIPKEESGLGYDVYAKPSPGGRKGWDVIKPIEEHAFREAQRAIMEASQELSR